MRTVTVTGHGRARIAPDSAVVDVAAVHRATGVAEALGGADSAADLVATTARRFTRPELIGSRSLQIHTAHDAEGRPDGFRARHSLKIQCADIDAAGALLSALAEAVGDRLEIDGVSLEVSEPAEAVQHAREAAYADAVERATHLAELAGAALGEPQEVVEGEWFGSPRRVAMPASLEAASFHPGETEIGSAVTVTFQLL
jgi:uncharacterized protein